MSYEKCVKNLHKKYNKFRPDRKKSENERNTSVFNILRKKYKPVRCMSQHRFDRISSQSSNISCDIEKIVR